MFPDTLHALCIWHVIAKNAVKHLTKQMRLEDVRHVQGLLWEFCLKEDLVDEGELCRTSFGDTEFFSLSLSVCVHVCGHSYYDILNNRDDS